MLVPVLRQALVAATAGACLLFGGASLSSYIQTSPAVLYTAGELRMAFGDASGGLKLIGRAESLRQAMAPKAAPASQPSPEKKPEEVCKLKNQSVVSPVKAPRDGSEAEFVEASVAAPSGEAILESAWNPASRAAFDRAWSDSMNHRMHSRLRGLSVKLDRESRERGVRLRILAGQRQRDLAAIMRDVKLKLDRAGIAPDPAMMVLAEAKR